jgi:hypothetical protein
VNICIYLGETKTKSVHLYGFHRRVLRIGLTQGDLDLISRPSGNLFLKSTFDWPSSLLGLCDCAAGTGFFSVF